MNSFRRVESLLLIGGILLFFTAFYFSVFKPDQVMVWLGYSNVEKLQAIGLVDVKKNQTRRRFQSSQEFLPVEANQPIYSRDTLMTGKDSRLIVVLHDGSLIEMAPDSLVEIRMKDESAGLGNLNFVVDVKTGQVHGSSPHQSITLAGAQAGPLPALVHPPSENIASAKKVGTTCEIRELKAESPFEREDGLAAISGTLQCMNGETAYDLSLVDETGKKVNEEKLIPNFKRVMQFKITVPAAGLYKLGGQEVLVPQHYLGIGWNTPALTCDRHLSYRLAADVAKKSALSILVETGAEKRTEGAWRKIAQLPTTIRLTAENNNHFILDSLPQTLAQWRDCPLLKNPEPSQIIKNRNKIILFTWVQADGTSYLFELSGDHEFKKLIYTEKTAKNFIGLNPKKNGKFYWRVRSLRTRDLSEVFEFEVQ